MARLLALRTCFRTPCALAATVTYWLGGLAVGSRDGVGYLYREIRGRVRDQVKTPEGIQKASDAYKSNLQVAAIIWSLPHFLLNISEKLRDGMRAKSAELWAPKGYGALNEGNEIAGLVRNYDKVSSDFHLATYNAEVVAEVNASRVGN
ncbi:hypothetical protein [Paenirhodobacter sp.]|uniref:hypothetical protein n=1 Tax=Paenirhodobacter sp. TaxID=1965326 RepID=UPI003B3F1ABB